MLDTIMTAESCTTKTELSLEAMQLISEQDLRPRELEVLQLMAEDFSNREIANELLLGLETVKTHIRNLYRKIDIRTRGGAVAYGFRNGLIM